MLITDLWDKQPGKYFCVATKGVSGVWREYWFTRLQARKRLQKFLRDNRSANIYACPHGFSKKLRRVETSVDPHLLYADLDHVRPEDCLIRPTIAIESSPGRYVGLWSTDKPCDDALNRRLAYTLGADPSGWDRTQMLRLFPGSRNYKYASSPRVRRLWSDGPEYKLSRLKKILPKEESVDRGETDEDAQEVYRKYEKSIPRWARRELTSGKPIPGKRSEVLWKLQNTLIEVGLTTDEAFALLWASPWNKFHDRRGGEAQLRSELEKSLSGHFKSNRKIPEGEEPEGDYDPTVFRPLSRSLKDVEVENIDWIIPSMFARGELTVIEGDPGLGKSYFCQMVAKSICDGEVIPTEKPYKPTIGRVAYFDMENTPGSVTKPRMLDNGMVNLDHYFQEDEPLSVDDEERWDAALSAIEELKPDMVVFDTLNMYIGSADTHKAAETQQAMAQFKQLAVRFNCAGVVIRHLTKGGKEKALYRGQGSIAVAGVARIVITVGSSPEDPSVRVVACTKLNIGPKFRSFEYTITPLPDEGGRTYRSKFEWGGLVDYSAEEIVDVADTRPSESSRDQCIEWLKKLLDEVGSVDQNEAFNMAESRGFSRSTLYRAVNDLGIKKDVVGHGKNRVSTWSLA